MAKQTIMSANYLRRGKRLRLEVEWSGHDDPPWFSAEGVDSTLVNKIIAGAMREFGGIIAIEEHLSSSIHLRLWLVLSKVDYERRKARRLLPRYVLTQLQAA